MEPEQASPELEKEHKFANLKKVTPLSKYLAMALFVALPFIGAWVGYTYAPEKVVEVERVVIQEVEAEANTSPNEVLPQCKVDSDCVLVSPDCEDCTFASMGSDELKDFRTKKQNHCELNPPNKMCDTVFTGEVKCIDNTCQIVENNELNDSETEAPESENQSTQTLIETNITPSDDFEGISLVSGKDSNGIEVQVWVESSAANNLKMYEGLDLELPEGYIHHTNGFIEIDFGTQARKDYRLGITPTSDFEVVMRYDGDVLSYTPFITDDGVVWASIESENGAITFALMDVPNY